MQRPSVFAFERIIILASALLFVTAASCDFLRCPLLSPSNLTVGDPIMGLAALLPVSDRRP
jgi:hypothetical protein